MQLEFAKMHGAGNDFIVVVDELPDEEMRARLIRFLSDRRFGIGADGVLWLDRSVDDPTVSFRWYGFNSDASPMAICINGFRCAALRVAALGCAAEEIAFLAGPHVITASVTDSGVTTTIPQPRTSAPISLPDWSPGRLGYPVDTGDPHLVVKVAADTLAMPLEEFIRLARRLGRPGKHFVNGANVHLVATDSAVWRIRSFERGVENETLACGSGCLASVCALASGQEPRVSLQVQSGDTLTVTKNGHQWDVCGPASTVFVGHVDIST